MLKLLYELQSLRLFGHHPESEDWISYSSTISRLYRYANISIRFMRNPAQGLARVVLPKIAAEHFDRKTGTLTTFYPPSTLWLARR